MYQRLKQSIYRKYTEDTEDTQDSHELEDVKIDKLQDDDDDADDSDSDMNEKDNKKTSISNKISTIIKSFASYITSGVSKSWFITSCFGIYTKYYLIYKISKKTPEDYNAMIKNIASKMSHKNIFFTKIFKAFANNNNF